MFVLSLTQRWGKMSIFFLFLCCFFSLRAKEIEHLIPQIIKVYPHDLSAFTQGLAIKDGILYESTGLYGASRLKKIDLQTCQVIQNISLPPSLFAEGIAIIENRLFQVTWKEHQAFIYNLHTLQLVGTLSYKGEGWGLCSDGKNLFTSNGTNIITTRDPSTFKIIKQYKVHLGKKTFNRLNDLECVDQSIYANIWGENTIIRFDKKTGEITGLIDASGLLTPEEKQSIGPEDVLNGIAYDADKKHFFITGKRWPWLFEVLFVPITQ